MPEKQVIVCINETQHAFYIRYYLHSLCITYILLLRRWREWRESRWESYAPSSWCSRRRRSWWAASPAASKRQRFRQRHGAYRSQRSRRHRRYRSWRRPWWSQWGGISNLRRLRSPNRWPLLSPVLRSPVAHCLPEVRLLSSQPLRGGVVLLHKIRHDPVQSRLPKVSPAWAWIDEKVERLVVIRMWEVREYFR